MFDIKVGDIVRYKYLKDDRPMIYGTVKEFSESGAYCSVFWFSKDHGCSPSKLSAAGYGEWWFKEEDG